MKYILFSGETHYAGGGILDIVNVSNDVEQLKKEAIKLMKDKNNNKEWFQIYDVEANKVLFRSKWQPFSYTFNNDKLLPPETIIYDNE